MNFQSKIFSLLSFLASVLTSFTINATWHQPPYEFPIISSSNAIAVASDANGHAFAIGDDILTSEVVVSYYLGSGVWSYPPQVIGTGFSSNMDLAMDNGGTALAIWYDLIGGTISTSHFDGVDWSTPPPDPLDKVSVFNFVPVAVAMNAPNQGVAIWTDNGTSTVRSSFFLGSSWTDPETIGTGNFGASVAFSKNNSAVAGWYDMAGGTTVNNFLNDAWQGPVALDPTGGGVEVGIDDAGKAIAVWINTAGNVVYSIFNPFLSLWSFAQPITTTTGNFNVSIGMTPAGIAVVTWQDSTDAGFSSSYNGSGFSPPILLTAGPIEDIFGHIALSVTDNGNAIAVWPTDTQVLSSRLPLGGTAWTPEDVVTDFPFGTTVSLTHSSLSEDWTGFAAWIFGGEGSIAFASSTLPPAPPTPPTPPSNLRGVLCKEKFAMQTECVKTITWTPSTDSTVVAYNIRKDGILVAIIPARGPFVFVNHACCGVINTFTVTAIDSKELASTPISVTF